MSRPSSSADGVAWKLDDLYAGPDDPRINADLEAAMQRALERITKLDSVLEPPRMIRIEDF